MSSNDEYSDAFEWNIIATDRNINASLDVQNTDLKENLSNKKMVVDYGVFFNKALPTFIPDKLNALYPTSATITEPPSITPIPIHIINNSMSVNSVDYLIRIKNIDSGSPDFGKTYVIYPRWSNELGLTAPPLIPATQQEFMQNKYYWSYGTAFFAQIISNAISEIYQYTGGSSSDIVQLVVGSAGFGLIVNKPNFLNTYSIEFSHNLNKLFLLQSIRTDNLFERLIFNPKETSYNIQTCLVCNSSGWSVEWFPFNQILIQSDLPIRKIQKQNNLVTSTSFWTTNYKNIILEFSILPQNPNSIYPYFEYTTESTNTKYVYFENDKYLKDTFTIDVLLYNITKNVIIPYEIKKDEFVNLKLRIFTKK